ncbi:hypothetical protein [Massilia horti]|uniref:Transporter n=1 Tax=Massilia horti TaxID=2562153 RepID=A0A4Y9SM20_9BURK|nr:hypothetical protein [Massilia horti]TFW27722.1 hypothetical protein E4O92_22940 [Massilia horti]
MPRSVRLLAGVCVMLASISARADLYDEIQVYDDYINRPKQFGLELHLNRTMSGRSTPDYPGEIPPAHGTRATFEFSYGLTEQVELGAYLPTVFDQHGNYYLAGSKLRLKWVPRRAPEEGGVFYGANFELGSIRHQFEASRYAFELRPIIGYRDPDWLFVINPVLGYPLSRGYRADGFDFSPQLKVSRNVQPGIGVGIETYMSFGKLFKPTPLRKGAQTLYLALDVDRAPWVFNVGIGRGLTAASDRWTIKAIFELPVDVR